MAGCLPKLVFGSLEM